MKRVAFSVIAMLSGSPALAQQATGVGVGIAKSQSASQAVAISGQGGGGGAGGGGGNASSNLTVNNGAPAQQSINNSGTITQRNVPAVFAPGLAAAGLETCLGSISGGGAVVGTGFSFGTSIPDPGCAARLDARTLWSMGLRKAAVARLCLNSDIYRSMPEVCVMYLPQQQAVGYTVAATEPAYTGGPIEVVMQKTGEHRICNNYDTTRHRCRAWAR